MPEIQDTVPEYCDGLPTRDREACIADTANDLNSLDGDVIAPPGYEPLPPSTQHLDITEQINNLYERPRRERIALLMPYTTEQILELMVLTNDKALASTFNIEFDVLLQKLQQDRFHRGNGYSLLLKDPGGIATFLQACGRHGKLQTFLETMRPEERQSLLAFFAESLEQTSPGTVMEAITLAEVLNSSREPSIVKILEEKIQQKYTQWAGRNAHIAKLYGIVASTHAGKAQTNPEWFAAMRERYPLPDFRQLDTSTLFDEQGMSIQQHFFYNNPDGDGRVSFQHFYDSYRRDPSWRIRDFGTYIVLEKRAPNGRHVQIYANKPEADIQGQADIRTAFQARGLIQNVNVIVHRSHSFDVEDTLKKAPFSPRTALVYLGSCTGFGNTATVISSEKAPHAQVILTKGTGTRLINNKLTKAINDQSLTSNQIDWATFRQEQARYFTSAKDKEYYAAYLFPHENMEEHVVWMYNNIR